MGMTKGELLCKKRLLCLSYLFFIASLPCFADSGGNWSTLFSPPGVVPSLSSSTRNNTVSFPTVKLRNKNLLVIGAQSGADINVVIGHVKIGSYTDNGTWELRHADMTYIANGTLNLGLTETIHYTPSEDEVVYLCIDMGRNAFKIQSSDAPIGISASEKAGLIGNSGRELFINVPSKWKKVSFTLYATSVNENVKIELYNPDHEMVANGETDTINQEVEIFAETGIYSGMVWKIKILPPTNGVLEDYKIKLDGNIPPVLTLDSQDAFAFSHFGFDKKLAVVVDKVLAASNLYDVEEWMVQEFKDAGFDVYVSRKFNGDLSTHTTDLEQLVELAGWCEAKDMKTLVWMRATLRAPLTDPISNGKRYLPGANEVSIWSPNSQELWDYLKDNIEIYATLSKTNPGIMGVFFDFEDYSPEKYSAPSVTAYYISYDDVIIEEFETEYNISITVADSERQQWLKDNTLNGENLHDIFIEFQKEKWRQKFKELRTMVDAINPQFQFYIYPFKGNDMFSSGALPSVVSQLSTPQAPIVHAESSLYSSDCSVLQSTGTVIDKAVGKMDSNIANAEAHGAPYSILAGFCPPCQLGVAYPLEYLARAPIVGGEKGNGFWVFYEGISYLKADGSVNPEHIDCMDYFEWSINKIDQEDWSAARSPYISDPSWNSLWGSNPPARISSSSAVSASPVLETKIRGVGIFVLSCTSGQQVNISLANSQLSSKYLYPTMWELRYGEELSSTVSKGEVLLAQNQTISFTPYHTGIYYLAVDSTKNAAIITSSNVPFAIYAAEYVNFHNSTTPLYVYVPEETNEFSVGIKSSGGEHVKATIYNPSGAVVTSDYTTDDCKEKNITLSVGSGQAGMWKIVPSSNGTDPFEDYFLKVSSDVAQSLSISSDYEFEKMLEVEVEDGAMTGNMQTASDSDYFESTYISGQTQTTDGCTVTFYIPETGNYYVWGRVWESDSTQDSFYVFAEGDDTSQKNSYIWDLYSGPEGEWKWLKIKTRQIYPRIFTWTQGNHTLTFNVREPGARLDKLLFTKDSTFVPGGH